jgi:hypothetical protein
VLLHGIKKICNPGWQGLLAAVPGMAGVGGTAGIVELWVAGAGVSGVPGMAGAGGAAGIVELWVARCVRRWNSWNDWSRWNGRNVSEHR